jgi:hypothetical protein
MSEGYLVNIDTIIKNDTALNVLYILYRDKVLSIKGQCHEMDILRV